MLIIWIVAFVAAIIGFAVVGYATNVQRNTGPKLIWLGLFAVITIVIGGVSYPIAHSAVQRGAVGGYHQYLNGSLVPPEVDKTVCTKDGMCKWTYKCDQYTVTVDNSYYDAKGVYHYEVDEETRWHSCPYATAEYTYTLVDSLGGKHVVASHIFASNAKAWGANPLPSNVARGVPARWQRAKDNIAAGHADPVTVIAKYDNYILGSEDTILKASSGDIARLKKAKLLPLAAQATSNPVHNVYQADKVHFVGFTPSNASAWQNTLMRFNAALGMEKQGDMQVVVLKDSALQGHGVSQRAYLNALKAYWLNGLGKNAIAKNAIIVVLGVDDAGTKVMWSEATTGMPSGNGVMLSSLSGLEGTDFTPGALFGDTTARIVSGKPSYTIGQGVIPQTVMVEYPFKRACMGCDDKGEKSSDGYVYLSTEISLGGWALFWTVLIDLMLMAALWVAGAWWIINGFPEDGSQPFSRRQQYPSVSRRW